MHCFRNITFHPIQKTRKINDDELINPIMTKEKYERRRLFQKIKKSRNEIIFGFLISIIIFSTLRFLHKGLPQSLEDMSWPLVMAIFTTLYFVFKDIRNSK